LLAGDDAERQEITNRLQVAGVELENITILQISTVDVWMRDYGPTFVLRQTAEAPLALNDWVFNGWGGKYKTYERDDGVAPAIAQILRLPVFSHPIVLEGGSIEVNGAGTCLTTEQCLLNKNRNPDLNRTDIERFLQSALGIAHVIWLGDGIVGDDTDGHIDDIARFTDEATVVCMVEENHKDRNYRALKDNVERLKEARDATGRKLNVVTIPSPQPIFYQGERLPASYANFYIANETVLVPIFNDANDQRTLGVLQELFPRRRVLGLDCTDVVAGLGAIHCITQQEPSVVASSA
jgi:agmatine deiminase